MKKNVAGIFVSSFEAVQQIQSMMHNGIGKDDIHMLTMDDRKAKEVRKRTGIDRLHGFPKKHLYESGWTKDEVDHYYREFKSGRLLVLVDVDHDMGRTVMLTTEKRPIKTAKIQVDNGQAATSFQPDHQKSRDRRLQGKPIEKNKGDIQIQNIRKEYEEETDPFEKRGG